MADVVIIGAGLAGLNCAANLSAQGISCTILEASDGVGGRARTDAVDGFLLDRGFQVLLTAYPEAQRALDYAALDLQAFEPGAVIRYGGKFSTLGDPWRRPSKLLATALSPVGTLADKLRVASLRRFVLSQSEDTLLQAPECSTREALDAWGFSEAMRERFFRPFLSGIFLRSDLETSARMFHFVFHMFSSGDAALPARGMGAMADQLAAKLPSGSVRLNAPVKAVTPNGVRLASGEEISAKAVVVATDGVSASSFLPQLPKRPWRGVWCLYFVCETPPVRGGYLVLNGDGKGPINNLTVVTEVAASYAPAGKCLISVSVVDGEWRNESQLLPALKVQLREWFGSQTEAWQHLRSYWIPQSLPDQSKESGGVRQIAAKITNRVYVCGDHCDTASINGALASGRRAAEAVLESLRR